MNEHSAHPCDPENFWDRDRAGKLIVRFSRAIAAEAVCLHKAKGALDSPRVAKRLVEHKRQVGGNYWKLLSYIRALEDALPEPLAASIKVQDQEAAKCHADMVEALTYARQQLVLLGGDRDKEQIGNEVHQSVLYNIDCAIARATQTEE